MYILIGRAEAVDVAEIREMEYIIILSPFITCHYSIVDDPKKTV